MQPSFFNRLSTKITLRSLGWLLALAFAIGMLIFWGFRQAQTNALKRSEQGLQTQASASLLNLAQAQAAYTASQLQPAADLVESAAQLFVNLKTRASISSWDLSTLESGSDGVWHDTNPQRNSDLIANPDLDFEAAAKDLQDSAVLEGIFSALLEQNPNATAVYYISPHGFKRYFPVVDLSATLGGNADVLADPFYQAMTPANNPKRATTWSPAYMDTAGLGSMVSVLTPIYEGEQFRGVIGMDILLSDLTLYLTNLRPTPEGFAVLIDITGNLIAAPKYALQSLFGEGFVLPVTDPGALIQQSLLDTPNEQLRDAVDHMRRGSSLRINLELGGRPVLMAYAPLEEIGWSLALVAPLDEITFQSQEVAKAVQGDGLRTLQLTIALIGVTFLVGLVGMVWFSQSLISKPIDELLGGVRSVAEGDLSVNIPVQNNDELGELAQSFNQMAGELLRRNQELLQANDGLRASEERYRALAQNFPNGAVLLFDSDLRFTLADGAGLADVGLSPAALEGKTVWDVFPAELSEVLEVHFRQALAGTANRFQVSYNGRIFRVHVLPIPDRQGRMRSGMVMTQDITEQAQAQQLLEQRVEDRTRELTTLLKMTSDVASTLDLKKLLNSILEQLKAVVGYDYAHLYELEGEDELVLLETYATGIETGTRTRIKEQSFEQMLVRDQELLICADINEDTPLARQLRENIAAAETPKAYHNIQSWIHIPLVARERVVGTMVLAHKQANYYKPSNIELVTAFAAQAAVALENAKLFSAEKRRAEQFMVINEVSQHINSILNMEELLQQTVQLISDAFGYYHVGIAIVEGGLAVYKAGSGAMWKQRHVRIIPNYLKVGQEGITGQVAGSGKPLLAGDVRSDPDYIHMDGSQTRSELAVPIIIKEQVIGVLDIQSDKLNAFDSSDQIVMQALANQLAVALENARLYEGGRTLAALEERQKLARELHDSVSQALYGIALGARTARTLLERDPGRAVEPVEYVLSLADAGLAEMRALIFELRPESLRNEGLVAALTKLSESLRARHHIQVEIEMAGEPEISLEAKEALYRIAQEGMHNIAKHAHAQRMNVSLREVDGQVELLLVDDGVGFDTGQDFPGHLGLKSMRERAEKLGGTLEMESSPGAGTKIRVRLG